MKRAAFASHTLTQLVRTPQAEWSAAHHAVGSAGELIAVAEALVGGDLRSVPLSPNWKPDHVQAAAPWMYAEEWPIWCAEVRARVTERRMAHVYRVALLAAQLAYAAGLDTRRAFAAGLLHDIARDLPEAELLRLAPPQCSNEAAHPLALHGRAASALLQRLGFGDAAVLRAVSEHVTGPQTTDVASTYGGAPAISALSACVYIADVSEPARGVNGCIRAAAFVDLGAALRGAIASKVEYLQGRGLDVHPVTLSLYRQLEYGTGTTVIAGQRLSTTHMFGLEAGAHAGAGANW